MARALTATQSLDWPAALFGSPPLSLSEWHHSTTRFATSGIEVFLSAERKARTLYLRMCQADLANPNLFATTGEKQEILAAWDFLRHKHNSVAKELPVYGTFSAVGGREVRPRAMSQGEVRDILRNLPVRSAASPQPHFARLRKKAEFTAAVIQDPGLSGLLSERLVVAMPSRYEIGAAIPRQGISLRNLLMAFASRLSIKTIANFVERIFSISAMDPTSRKLLPVPSLEEAEKMPQGRHREAVVLAAKLCKPPPHETINPKLQAFTGEQMEYFFVYQVMAFKMPVSRKPFWRWQSQTAFDKDMKILEPLLEAADQKLREREQEGAEAYVQLDKEIAGMKQRRDSLLELSSRKRKMEDEGESMFERRRKKVRALQLQWVG